jgi:hypothetical protein
VASVTSWVPLCMDASEFASWRQMNLRVAGNNQAKRPCDDCPLGFAAEMRGIGRCNGSPGGVEEEDEMEIKELKAKASVVSVQVAVPCERCIHREVCGIRQQIADLDSVEMELPALNPALKPALTMAIECAFYTPERKGGRPKRQMSEAGLESARQNAAKAREAMAAKRAQAAS